LRPILLLKRALKKIIELRRKEYGEMARRDRFSDMHRLLDCEEPIIIDGGANRGITIKSFLKTFNNCSIVESRAFSAC
jgi:hypothetical protein